MKAGGVPAKGSIQEHPSSLRTPAARRRRCPPAFRERSAAASRFGPYTPLPRGQAPRRLCRQLAQQDALRSARISKRLSLKSAAPARLADDQPSWQPEAPACIPSCAAAQGRRAVPRRSFLACTHGRARPSSITAARMRPKRACAKSTHTHRFHSKGPGLYMHYAARVHRGHAIMPPRRLCLARLPQHLLGTSTAGVGPSRCSRASRLIPSTLLLW